MSMVDLALLILRVSVGLTFAAHGAQKAFGWWEGPGPERWHGAVQSMGFRPPRLFWAASIGAELVGGILLAIGFLTPLAAAVLIAQSVVIIFQVHWPKGFFSTRGGIEFALQMLVVAVAVGLAGPGRVSVDNAVHLSYSDTVRIAFVLLGFVAGAVSYALPRLAPRANASHAA